MADLMSAPRISRASGKLKEPELSSGLAANSAVRCPLRVLALSGQPLRIQAPFTASLHLTGPSTNEQPSIFIKEQSLHSECTPQVAHLAHRVHASGLPPGSCSENAEQNWARTLAHGAAAPRGYVAFRQRTAELRTGPVNAEPSQVLWKGMGTAQVETTGKAQGLGGM